MIGYVSVLQAEDYLVEGDREGGVRNGYGTLHTAELELLEKSVLGRAGLIVLLYVLTCGDHTGCGGDSVRTLCGGHPLEKLKGCGLIGVVVVGNRIGPAARCACRLYALGIG